MTNPIQPPKWVDKLIERLAPPHLAEEIVGDLFEFFVKDIQRVGARKARQRYAIHAIGFLFKNFFWNKHESHITNNPLIMFSSYFKMAKRSLMSYKGNTVINILGLVIGIASALVILTVIRFELSFDKFHSDADRIYRVIRVTGTGTTINEKSECRTGVSYPLPLAMKEEIASLQKITSVQSLGGAFIEIPDASGKVIRKFQESGGCALAEPSFFSIFDFKGTGFQWVEGNPENALTEPFSIVLTKTIADKYFPEGDALGKSLKYDRRTECKVTGVVQDLPDNTDFPFTILVSYSTFRTLMGDRLNDWSSVDDDNHVYVVPGEGTTKEELEAQIEKVHAAHTSKDLHESRHYLLQSLSDVHYDPRFGTFAGRTITQETLMALGLVALFLLFTGCINYINLATAQSTMRSKEVGLRKVMGSNRNSLVLQFLTETFVVVSVAGVVALGLSEVLLFNLQSLLNIELDGYNFTDPFILSSLLGIIVSITLLAGIYPSLSISRFDAVTAMKKKFSSEAVGGFSLRKVLVVAQFTITQILVVGTFIVVAQMNFFHNVDMGFNKEAIINMTMPDRDPNKRQLIVDQLRARSFVRHVGFSYTLPSGANRSHNYRDIGKSDATQPSDYVIFEYQSADSSFLDLYQIKLLAGRNFQSKDSAHYVLINRTVAKNLQLGTPEKAVGSELKMNGNRKTVIGVFEDYYSNSLKSEVGNIVMEVNPQAYRTLSVKIHEQSSLPEAVKEVKKIWLEAYPDYLFEYQFFDDNIRAFYEQEQKYSQLFQLFSLTFLLIGCLGLYGLITFVVNRKGKEIAIRKVLGATIPGILVLFSREYIQLILLSFALATPVAYYAVSSWLNNFAHHIPLHWWLFLLPGVLVLSLSLLVVVLKSWRAAGTNPIDNLKYE